MLFVGTPDVPVVMKSFSFSFGIANYLTLQLLQIKLGQRAQLN